MPTPERCRAQAQEAEEMAAVVSYERDRERLLRQAAEWRSQAEAMEVQAGAPAGAPEDVRVGRASWLRRVWRALSGPRRGG